MSREGRTLASAEGITFRYGEKLVLRDASFSLGAGQVVALLGPNGSGKSTLLRLMSGVQRPGRRALTGRIRIGETETRQALQRLQPGQFLYQATLPASRTLSPAHTPTFSPSDRPSGSYWHR